MSEPVKTSSELIHKYAGILDNIVRAGTQGSYTYHGVLGCFLNEWLEMPTPEEGGDTQDEFMDAVDEVLEEDRATEDDPAIMQAFNAHRDGRRSE